MTGRGDDEREDAAAVLETNRRDGYTIPSDELYPFQWNWDSAFIALGLAHVDPAAAKAEIRTLCRSQWENGMIPQIAFWTDAAGYFPGPGEWQTGNGEVATSGITQPPMVVPAARRVYELTGDDDFLTAVLPSLDAYCQWWFDERAPDGALAYVRHPWATGMDDSPAWTPVLESFDPGDVEYSRADRKRADLAEQRPTDWDYDRYVALVRQGVERDWDEAALREVCPFQVYDALTNALLARACADLADLYGAVDAEEVPRDSVPADPRSRREHWADRAEAVRAAMRDRLWDDELGNFVSYDRVGDRPLRAQSVAGLVSLYGGVPTERQAARLFDTLRDDFLALDYGVPSYVGPDADHDRYWRGPVWVNTNWLVAEGLAAYGQTGLADLVRSDTLSLIEREGFREYYNPVTGDGRGSDAFSWSAALALDLWARE